MGRRKVNTSHLFMSLKLKTWLCSNRDNLVITTQILFKSMYFIDLTLIKIFTEQFLNQKTESREIGEKLWDVLNTEISKNAPHLIYYADLEWWESAVFNRNWAEVLMSWEGGALVIIVKRSGVLMNESGLFSQSATTADDTPLDVDM